MNDTVLLPVALPWLFPNGLQLSQHKPLLASSSSLTPPTCPFVTKSLHPTDPRFVFSKASGSSWQRALLPSVVLIPRSGNRTSFIHRSKSHQEKLTYKLVSFQPFIFTFWSHFYTVFILCLPDWKMSSSNARPVATVLLHPMEQWLLHGGLT
jgi:hypothetical protein